MTTKFRTFAEMVIGVAAFNQAGYYFYPFPLSERDALMLITGLSEEDAEAELARQKEERRRPFSLRLADLDNMGIVIAPQREVVWDKTVA